MLYGLFLKLSQFFKLAQAPNSHDFSSNTDSVISLQSEQTRLLYANLPVSATINAMLALILAGIQSELVPLSHIVTWLLILALVLLVRVCLAIAWWRSDDKARQNTKAWLLYFRLTVIANGFVWGIGSIFLYSPESFEHQVYVAFVLAGLCAGGITTLSIDGVSVFGFLLPTLLPYTTFLILQDDFIHMNMSVMVLLFLCFMAASARQAGFTLRENFLLRSKAIEAEQRFRSLLANSPMAIHITNCKTQQVIFTNQSYATLIGVEKSQVIGVDPVQYYAHPKDYADILVQLEGGRQVNNRLAELVCGDEMQTSKWALATYLQTEYQGEPAIFAWLYDITDRKEMEEKVQHLAHHDFLTGLPNRVLLNDRLSLALSTAARNKSSVTLVFVDLDKFKPINDNYGHEIGDQLLKGVAERIRKFLRKSDSVARIGGDEFVVLLPGVEAAEEALMLAEKIHGLIKQPFELSGCRLHISSSIGVAIYPDHAAEEQELIHHADIAMYYAKKRDNGSVQIYKAGMGDITKGLGGK